jgi:uncharacterized protein (DUF488 family)
MLWNIHDGTQESAHMTIYTIGHSTHPIDSFLQTLRAYSIRKLIDIRTIPRSAHNPQFEQTNLRTALTAVRISYIHMPALGGLRHTSRESPNGGWRNRSFRGYADYMQTQEFRQAIDDLIEIGKAGPVAIMCAEAVPWRCHRSLIGDALIVRNVNVEDIFTETSSKPHKLTPWARVDGLQITYPEAGPA